MVVFLFDFVCVVIVVVLFVCLVVGVVLLCYCEFIDIFGGGCVCVVDGVGVGCVKVSGMSIDIKLSSYCVKGVIGDWEVVVGLEVYV